ncbi:CC0125/CC1285 family lipoprotein [Variovorax sp.]|uniref:CC0125/CC1285 family lipoprotein n=1 Tax=Variovorax sp. TaxID=1871043 RepID=UPI003BAD029F
MKLVRLAAVLAIALAAAACSTPYKSNGIGGGFSETRRADDIYVVRFQGNGFTSNAEAEEMVLLRAAELSLEKGYPYFAVLNERSQTSTAVLASPAQSVTTGTIDRWGSYRATTVTTGGSPIMASFPSATLHIGLAKEKFSQNYQFLDADSIVADLGKKYKR